MKHGALDLLAAALIAVMSLAVLSRTTGHVTANGGAGFDGKVYVDMVNDGWKVGTPNTQLRPFLLWIVEFIDYYTFRNPVTTFRILNYVFAAALAVFLSLLARDAGADRASALVLIVNVSLTIAAAKMFAFYPVLVDLGAFAMMTAAVWFARREQRVAAGLACTFAALSREFGPVVAVYGIVRDVRLRRAPWKTALTYAPAFIAYFALRYAVIDAPHPADQGRLNTVSVLLGNAILWQDWLFWLFIAYFLVTIFGGVTMLLAAHGMETLSALGREYELLGIVVPIVAVTLLGHADLWRYLAFVLPAVAPLYGAVVRRARPSYIIFGLMTVGTLITQQPWQRLDDFGYFREWFPYFELYFRRHDDHTLLWAEWAPRIVAAAVLVPLLAISTRIRRGSAVTVTSAL